MFWPKYREYLRYTNRSVTKLWKVPSAMPLRAAADTEGATWWHKHRKLSGLMTEQRLVPLSCLFIFLRLVVAFMDKLLTNNSMAAERFAGVHDVDYRDCGALELLKAARDMVHLGHRLLTHPVTSGTAPNGSPFVSIVISAKADGTDFDSVSIIEGAIGVYGRLKNTRELPETIMNDFMLIDCEMLAKDTQIYKLSR